MQAQWRKVGNQLVVTTSTAKEQKKRKAASKPNLSFGEALVLSQDGVIAIGNQQDSTMPLKVTKVKRERNEVSKCAVVKREPTEDLPVPKGRPVKLEPGMHRKPANVAARLHRTVVKKEPGIQGSSNREPVIKREPGMEPVIVDLTELADHLAEAIVPITNQSHHLSDRQFVARASGPSNAVSTTTSGSTHDSSKASLFPPRLLQQLLRTVTSRHRARRTETRPDGSSMQMWTEQLRNLLVQASSGTSQRSILGSGLVRRQLLRESRADGTCLMRETLTLQRTRRIPQAQAATTLKAGCDRFTATADSNGEHTVQRLVLPRPRQCKRIRLI